MEKVSPSVSKWPALSLLLLVNLVAVSFFFSPGTGDVSIWNTWMDEISGRGMLGGFSNSGTDYPPLAFVILGWVVQAAKALGLAQVLVLKGSLLLFLFATAASFYWFSRNLLLTAALELSLILNSVALGYLDVYFAPFLIAAFFLLRRGHLTVGFLFYAISCSIKWQPLVILPFVSLYVFRSARNSGTGTRGIKRQFIPFVITALLVAVPLLLGFGVPAVFDSLKRALTYHKFLSGYALNLEWIETWALHLCNPEKYGALINGAIEAFITRDPLLIWPNKILFYLIYLAVLAAFVLRNNSFERLVIYSMLGFLAYFNFNMSVHENHLFLVCCLAWILVLIEPTQLVRCFNFCIAANANLFLFYGVFGHRIDPVVAGFDITLLFAIANLALFAGFLVHAFRRDNFVLKPGRSLASATPVGAS
jgi:hypothetical protein